jgi:hypothetical protein
MRRWLTAVALGAVTALAVAGCGTPAGVDGDLTDDWAAIGEPKAFVPAAGVCHLRFQEIGYLSSYEPVDCAQPHLIETVHVGSFAGGNAQGAAPPGAGSPGHHAAHGECDRRAQDLLGADWRSARLVLRVVVPSSAAWNGGSRWFRCDMSEIDNLDDAEWVERTGSLKGVLAAASPLSYGCFTPKLANDEVEEMIPVACDKPHRSEFAGIYLAPDTSLEAFEKNSAAVHKGCVAVIARFAKVPNDRNIRYRTGSIFYNPGEDEWAAGDRGVKCFLWVDRNLTRSMKGAGPQGLPIT